MDNTPDPPAEEPGESEELEEEVLEDPPAEEDAA